MPIIDCPRCGKQISSLAPICDHCGYSDGKASAEDIRRYRERSIRDRLYKLGMTSYVAMTLVIAAFGWYWLATGSFQHPPATNGPYYLMMIGALSYLIVRVLIFQARSRRKAIRKGEF